MSESIYAYSKLTGTWYEVFEYEDKGDGKIVAESKREVDREDVPQEYLDATKETTYAEERQ